MMPGRGSRAVLPLVALALWTSACSGAAERGRRLYAERGCAVCHGATGRGDGPTAKRLDIPPRDLTDVRTYRQGSGETDIAASIRAGTGPGGAMPAFRDIDESEARDIAAWIVSLQQAGGSARKP